MEPVFLQELLNNSSDKNRFPEPYSGPFSTRRRLFSQQVRSERACSNWHFIRIKDKSKAKISSHHKSIAPQTYLDIVLRICPACDRRYGLYLLTVIVFEPSLLHVPRTQNIRE